MPLDDKTFDAILSGKPATASDMAGGAITDIIRGAAAKYDIDPDIMVSLANRESGLRPDAKNPKSSAGGLFQFIDGTWKQYGRGDKFDPAANADAAARMLRDNLDRFGGNYDAALAAHHVGPGKALQALRDSSIGDVNVSTQKWLADIKGQRQLNDELKAQKRNAFLAEDNPEYRPDFGGDIRASAGSRSALQAIGDSGAALLKGAGNFAESMGGLYNLISGEEGQNMAQTGGKALSDFAEAHKSEFIKNQEKLSQQDIDQAEGHFNKFVTAAGGVLANPALAANFLLEQGVNFIPGMAAGRIAKGIIAGLGGASAAAIEAAPLAQKAMLLKRLETAGQVGTGVSVATGAVLQGADAGNSAYQQMMARPQAEWDADTEYQQLVTTLGTKGAKHKIALDESRAAFLKSGGVSAILNAASPAHSIDKMLVNGIKNRTLPEASRAVAAKLANQGAIRATAAGAGKAFVGEAASEGFDEGYGQYAANEAEARINPNKDVLDRVAENAGLGAAFGPVGAMTGGVEGYQRRKLAQEAVASAPVNPLQEAAAKLNSPLSRAAAAAGDVGNVSDQNAYMENPRSDARVAAIERRDELSNKASQLSGMLERMPSDHPDYADISERLQSIVAMRDELQAKIAEAIGSGGAQKSSIADLRRMLDSSKYDDIKLRNNAVQSASRMASQLADEESSDYVGDDAMQAQYAQQQELQSLINEERQRQQASIKDTWLDQHIARTTQGPTRGFGDMVEYESFLRGELDHLGKVRSDAVAAGDQRRAQEAEAVQRNAEARLQEINQAIEDGRKFDSAAKRDALLGNILDTLPPGQNPSRAFDRALRDAGFNDTKFSDAERAKIEQWQQLSDGFMQQQAEPSNPNQLDAGAVGIKEKQEFAPVTPGAKLREVEAMLKAGMVRRGPMMFNQKTGKSVKLSPAQIARAKKLEADAKEKIANDLPATEQVAQEATQANDAQTGAEQAATPQGEVSAQNLQAPAQAEPAGLPVQGIDTQSAPVQQAATVPVSDGVDDVEKQSEQTIDEMQDALEKANFGERMDLNGRLIEMVTADAQKAIDDGEMPVYPTGQGTFVAIHPSAQNDGMIQVTRYSDRGVFGDSQYRTVIEAVRDNGLWFKKRANEQEAWRMLDEALSAEAAYQKRREEAQNQNTIKNAKTDAAKVSAESEGDNQESIKKTDRPGAEAVTAPEKSEASNSKAPFETIEEKSNEIDDSGNYVSTMADEFLSAFNEGEFKLPAGVSAANKEGRETANRHNSLNALAYAIAAKRFAEGDLTAKSPGVRDDMLNLEFLDNIQPQQVPKKIGKVKDLAATLKALHPIAAEKDLRYYLNGVHFDESGALVATDGARVAMIRDVDTSAAPANPMVDSEKRKRTVLNRDGQWIEGIYPDWQRVLPEINGERETWDAAMLGDAARAILKAGRYSVGAKKLDNLAMNLRIDENDVSFSAKYVSDMTDLFRRMGYEQFIIGVNPGVVGQHSLIAESPDGKVRQRVMGIAAKSIPFATVGKDGYIGESRVTHPDYVAVVNNTVKNKKPVAATVSEQSKAPEQAPINKPSDGKTDETSEALAREMSGFAGVSDIEYQLRQMSHKDKQDGDVELGNGKFITLEQAVSAAQKHMDKSDWGKPFQFSRVLDIAPIDWNRMVEAMKGADAQTSQEASNNTTSFKTVSEEFDFNDAKWRIDVHESKFEPGTLAWTGYKNGVKVNESAIPLRVAKRASKFYERVVDDQSNDLESGQENKNKTPVWTKENPLVDTVGPNGSSGESDSLIPRDSSGKANIAPATTENKSSLDKSSDNADAIDMRQRIDAAAERTAENPSPAQIEADNFAQGKFPWNGLRISIETAKDGIRRDKETNGKKWQVTMPAHYGKILGTTGADGDHVDVFVGEHPESDQVFIINQTQVNSDAFDEHKVLIGYQDAESAKEDYLASFSDGFGRKVFGSLEGQFSVDEFKQMLPELDKKREVGKGRRLSERTKLSDITVTVDAVEAETGRTVEMEENAADALKDVDDRMQLARSLLECLAS